MSAAIDQNRHASHAGVRDLLDIYQPGIGLPQDFYRSESIFNAEMEAIWYRSWIFAGMSCDIPDAGSWFTVDIGQASVIVVRDADGNINAFHNTCRHRGSRICLKEQGKSRNLVCPYHHWTYGTDGSLLHARDMGEAFDKSAHSLRPVKVGEVAGYVFICLSESAPDFGEFRHAMEPYLLPHDLKEAKVAHEATLIEKANWKLVIENNRECYHCKVGHPELMRTIADVEATDDPRCSPEFVLKARDDKARWDAQGLPHELRGKSLEGWQIIRVPMTRGRSFTMSGEPASGLLMGTLPDFDVGSVRLLRFPSTWNHALGDHAISFRVTPIDAQTTAVTTKWLVHKDAVEGVDYDLDALTTVWKATNEQDRTLAENNQLGISSPAYRPGPLSPSMEYGVVAFLDWYIAAMRARFSS